MEQKPLRKVDIIWNMTLICPWNCANCCVDAVHVVKKHGEIWIAFRGLTQVERIPYQPNKGNQYEQALAWRQAQGLELDLTGKLLVLDHLAGFDSKIDFSGGDAMVVSENFEVMCKASEQLGRDRITLTATGAGLFKYDVEQIAPLIAELNFTYDNVSPRGNEIRPAGYANGNLRKAAKFAAKGVKTRGECPLSIENINDETLRQLYMDLHDEGIDKLLLMRQFPVGRETMRTADIPTPQQYRRAIDTLREMEAKYTYPKLKIQCALKFFDNSHREDNPCDLLRESFGLMANGTLLASPWAINNFGQPLDEAWVLGNLATTPLDVLLATEKVREYENRLNENFGQCKIFAFLNSKRARPMDRIFDASDPLYAPNSAETLANMAETDRR